MRAAAFTVNQPVMGQTRDSASSVNLQAKSERKAGGGAGYTSREHSS